ncbi:DUF418 domain-containing protein [Robertkochia marina]|uniref:DUF418 domain-containing protein n=1 Tax=Robertkochia marina TaxID=1227945 RepID=A0A4S3M4Y2_9FLAO|nr:DUF418 domain-containing protein [Robertkochia marina]THD69267.1 DUF418 domain-containing protein [Robertkochia marina]TRZ47474.1 DUF418 domain-containing protein [Robertkochia marina]
MTTNPTSLRPTSEKERIRSLDILRGVALLGILILNILGFAFIFDSYSNPTLINFEGINKTIWQITSLLFEGTMRGLFSILFGVGFLLFLSRLEKKIPGGKAIEIYYRRLLWLMLFGLFHAYVMLWSFDILFHYGLMALILLPFRHLKAKHLLLCSLLMLGIETAKGILNYTDTAHAAQEATELLEKQQFGISLSETEANTIKSWQQRQEKMTPEQVAMKNKGMQGSYLSVWKNLKPQTDFWLGSATFSFVVWDLLCMFFLGMALYKWNILQNGKSGRFYLIMALVGYGFGLMVNYWEMQAQLQADFSPLATAKTGTTYGIGRFFTTLGHIALVMLWIKTPFLGSLQKALAAVGRMALTNYMVQTLLCGCFFYGYGLGYFGKLERYETYYVMAAVWLIQLVVSPLWLHYFRFGPMEWAWRSLTYWKLQPMKRISKEKVTVSISN